MLGVDGGRGAFVHVAPDDMHVGGQPIRLEGASLCDDAVRGACG